MAKPLVLILRAPGTNCNRETAFAFDRAGGQSEHLHINEVLESSDIFEQYQILCLPGGFSYGDDIAAGRIWGNQIRNRLSDALQAFRDDGKLILGICNGFQVLIKSGLLLEDGAGGAPATLTWNDSGRFEDRWVEVETVPSDCVFFEGIQSMYLPVAHAEGKFVARDADALERLHRQSQVVLRYRASGASGGAAATRSIASSSAAISSAAMSSTATASTVVERIAYPDNPNGSQANIAGVCDASGRVCGIMPHPERHVDFTQHPRWTRTDHEGTPDGLRVFRNAVAYFS